MPLLAFINFVSEGYFSPQMLINFGIDLFLLLNPISNDGELARDLLLVENYLTLFSTHEFLAHVSDFLEDALSFIESPEAVSELIYALDHL